jgi:hypothetical protein
VAAHEIEASGRAPEPRAAKAGRGGDNGGRGWAGRGVSVGGVRQELHIAASSEGAREIDVGQLADGLAAQHELDMVRNFDMSLSRYQKIERGDLDVRLSTAQKLAQCFGVTVPELMRGLA